MDYKVTHYWDSYWIVLCVHCLMEVNVHEREMTDHMTTHIKECRILYPVIGINCGVNP